MKNQSKGEVAEILYESLRHWYRVGSMYMKENPHDHKNCEVNVNFKLVVNREEGCKIEFEYGACRLTILQALERQVEHIMEKGNPFERRKFVSNLTELGGLLLLTAGILKDHEKNITKSN